MYIVTDYFDVGRLILYFVREFVYENILSIFFLLLYHYGNIKETVFKLSQIYIYLHIYFLFGSYTSELIV